ncbi:MAG: hypothetical protein WC659_04030 [Patescibacteria group bacterium]
MNIDHVSSAVAEHFGGLWEITAQQRTLNGVIFFLRSGSREMVAKAPALRLFAQTPIADRIQTAYRINQDAARYRELLKKYNVPLAHEFKAIILPGGEALHVVSHEGPNCLAILESQPTLEIVRTVIRGILEAVMGVLHQPDPPEVGIDLKLDNFTKNGGIFYVDQFPPLYYDAARGAYIVHEPQPEDPNEVARQVQRKFTVNGNLRRFRSFILKVSRVFENVWLEEVERVLDPSLWREVRAFFENLPGQQLRPPVRRADFLMAMESLKPDDYDGMRDVALRVVPGGSQRKELLDQVFLAARFRGPDGNQLDDPKSSVIRLLVPFCRSR